MGSRLAARNAGSSRWHATRRPLCVGKPSSPKVVPSTRPWSASLRMDSDAVLFVTPEYNRSIPGVLKNAIDHASRPYGQSVWAGKPAGIIGVSVGAMGTAMAQQHLRNVLACLDVPTLGLTASNSSRHGSTSMWLGSGRSWPRRDHSRIGQNREMTGISRAIAGLTNCVFWR